MVIDAELDGFKDSLKVERWERLFRNIYTNDRFAKPMQGIGPMRKQAAP